MTLFLAANAPGQPAMGYNELGANYFKEGRYAEALERFEKALQIAPGAPPVLRNMALCHQGLAKEAVESGNLTRALSHLNKAIELTPEDAGPHAQAGAYLFGANKPTQARKHLEAALKLDPNLLEARAMLGEIHYRKNDFTRAQRHWSRVLRIKPDWPGLQARFDKLKREDRVEAAFESYSSEHFEIRYGKVLSDKTRARVFTILEAAYQDIGTVLGGIFPPETIHVVLYDGMEFADATQTDKHVGALFDGKIRAPITNKKGRFLGTPTLTSRLRHEYVHVVLRHSLGGKIPWWLNEGLAESLSRAMDKNRLRRLRTAYRGEETFPFSELENNPRKRLKANQVSVAYAQSHVAVNALWTAMEKKKFPALLQGLRSGMPPEEALRQHLGLDYAELDRRTVQACQRAED